MQVKRNPEKECAAKINALQDQLSFETKEILNGMSSGLRMSLLNSLEYSKGSIILI